MTTIGIVRLPRVATIFLPHTEIMTTTTTITTSVTAKVHTTTIASSTPLELLKGGLSPQSSVQETNGFFEGFGPSHQGSDG